MEKENDSNMATLITQPTLLSMNGKQRPVVSFGVSIGSVLVILLLRWNGEDRDDGGKPKWIKCTRK